MGFNIRENDSINQAHLDTGMIFTTWVEGEPPLSKFDRRPQKYNMGELFSPTKSE